MYSLILLTYSSLIYLFGFFSNIFPSYICLWQHLTFITKKDQVEGRYLPNRDTHWYRQTFNFFAPFRPLSVLSYHSKDSSKEPPFIPQQLLNPEKYPNTKDDEQL